MSHLENGLRAVGRRVEALGGAEADSEETLRVSGDRHEIIRRIVSGFIPLDDTDDAIVLVETVANQVIAMLGGLVPDFEATEAEMNTLMATSQAACAQMLAIGGAAQMSHHGDLA